MPRQLTDSHRHAAMFLQADVAVQGPEEVLVPRMASWRLVFARPDWVTAVPQTLTSGTAGLPESGAAVELRIGSGPVALRRLRTEWGVWLRLEKAHAEIHQPGHARIDDPVIDEIAVSTRADDAAVYKPLELVRHCLRRYGDGVGQVGDAQLAGGLHGVQQPEAVLVGENLEQPHELGRVSGAHLQMRRRRNGGVGQRTVVGPADRGMAVRGGTTRRNWLQGAPFTGAATSRRIRRLVLGPPVELHW